MSLAEAKNIIATESSYKLYEIEKAYENNDYFKFILFNKPFDMKKIVIFDRNKNTFFDLDSSNTYRIEGVSFKEV